MRSISPRYLTRAALGAGLALLLAACSDPAGPDDPGLPLSPPRLALTANTTCALAGQSALWCWGGGENGEIGNGATASPTVPTQSMVAPPLVTITAGGFHLCGLTADGVAYCWGHNGQGSVGMGATTPEAVSTPTAVSGGLRFRSISLANGWLGSCGLVSDGGMYCWGSNQFWWFGDDSPIVRDSVPRLAGHDLRFTALDLGAGHGCGLEASGAIWCWGSELPSVPGFPGQRFPVRVDSVPTFTSFASGTSHACGLTAGGAAYCWGSLPLDDASGASHWVREVSTTLRFERIVAGYLYSCGLTRSGDAWCWGHNFEGALGDGTTTTRPSPVKVLSPKKLIEIATGNGHTCAIATDGTAYCWGFNGVGQLGDGTTTRRLVPTQVLGGVDFRAP
ncbi:MAG: hypothetical protein IPJ78_01360 [Gemmatimonadetes bacterium]|jgi:alpha-tubulin suppressor-like RCC1 family protein|nr:hypothetical protein [Gemmatimonadota bacterium]MBP7551440.1 hypothetical protein [Gemmatimonadaceae bacterium]